MLAHAEESFFRQKSRLRWLMEGDANTGFFHKSVLANLAKNIIHYLRDDFNLKVSDPADIKNMILSYHTYLLGTKNAYVLPLSVSKIQHLHPFRCSGSLSTLLASIPTDEVIREAVFLPCLVIRLRVRMVSHHFMGSSGKRPNMCC